MRRRSVLSLLTLAVLAGFATPAAGQVESVTVEVHGLACPFCTFGVEKKLREVPGVAAVEVSMREGTASLTAAEGASIEVARVPGAVREAGFTPAAGEIVAVGVVGERAGPGWSFRVAGADRELLLVNLEGELAERVAALSGSATEVRVSGGLHFHVDHPPAVEPTAIEEVGGADS